MDKSATRPLFADTVDTFTYLNVYTSLNTYILTLPRFSTITIPQACSDDETSVLNEASASLSLEVSKVTLIQGLILVDITMVSSNEDIGSIRITDVAYYSK